MRGGDFCDTRFILSLSYYCIIREKVKKYNDISRERMLRAQVDEAVWQVDGECDLCEA